MGVSETRTERLRRALEQAYAAAGEGVAIPTPELAYATGLSAGTTLKLLKRMELDRMCSPSSLAATAASRASGARWDCRRRDGDAPPPVRLRSRGADSGNRGRHRHGGRASVSPVGGEGAGRSPHFRARRPDRRCDQDGDPRSWRRARTITIVSASTASCPASSGSVSSAARAARSNTRRTSRSVTTPLAMSSCKTMPNTLATALTETAIFSVVVPVIFPSIGCVAAPMIGEPRPGVPHAHGSCRAGPGREAA